MQWRRAGESRQRHQYPDIAATFRACEQRNLGSAPATMTWRRADWTVSTRLDTNARKSTVSCRTRSEPSGISRSAFKGRFFCISFRSEGVGLIANASGLHAEIEMGNWVKWVTIFEWVTWVTRVTKNYPFLLPISIGGIMHLSRTSWIWMS